MNDKKSNIESFEEEKLKTKKFFLFFFLFYLILFLYLWGEAINEFGFFYIFGIGCFGSFFCAWASSLFVILLKKDL
ncbi:MAG: hypothetical protein CBD16_02965 [Betaproteobacteria bacterium TMED156]|nr:MAG: hypothetical protein CBD16_02965 [Betaproteobacteria bacterium TMED156]